MWETKKLSEIAYINYGKGLSTSELSEKGFPVFGANGIIGYYDEYHHEEEMVLISCRGAASGSINISPPKAFITNNSLVLEFESDKLLKKFMYYALKEVDKSRIISGSAQPQVTISNANELELSIPPLATQNRIVEKIEELFSELDHGMENLKMAQKQLKTYRQAVLKDAFEGKLTKEWRDQQTNLPSPDELLQQIKAERKNHHQRELTEWEKEVEQWEMDGKPGRKPSKPRKISEIDPITENQSRDLKELPNDWFWLKLGEIIEQPKYGTSEKCDYDFEGYGVIRIPNIGKGIIDSKDMKYAPLDNKEASKYELEIGDILTIRSNGSIDLVGRCAIVREPDVKYLHAGYLIRLRPFEKVADSKYLKNVLSSGSLREQIESKAKSTSGVNNINSGELQDLIIPYCSVIEQNQIVQEIESRLSVVDQLEKTIKINLQKAEALRQSILKKAFGGELVEE